MRTIGGNRFFVANDELTTEPTENVISDTGGIANVRILGEATWFETRVSKFFDQALQWNAILQGDRGQGRNRIHQTTDRTPLLGHLNEQFARLSIFIETHGDVAFVSGDLELMGKRDSRIRHAPARRLVQR